MAESNSCILGLNIGGTNCSVSLADSRGTLIETSRFETSQFNGPERLIDLMCREAERMSLECKKLRGAPPVAAGISCGGPLDSQRGLILSPPNLPGWDEFPIVERVSSRVAIPTRLENDANACALAEFHFGAGRGYSNIVFLTFGTGMGAGFILNGELYRGTNDMAGEIGHVRMAAAGPSGYGKAGSFEGFCSGRGIASLGRNSAQKLLSTGLPCSFCSSIDQIDHITAKEIGMAAAAGEADALEIIETSARYLGEGLSILIDLLNPQCVVIGSIYTRNEHLFKPVIDEVLKTEPLSRSLGVCSIVPSTLGERIGDYGAISVALTAID